MPYLLSNVDAGRPQNTFDLAVESLVDFQRKSARLRDLNRGVSQGEAGDGELQKAYLKRASALGVIPVP